ncbi:hypothetical protein JVU11DRAFT_9843 [Chiua virens]|nr:hypothetical protein JVU11DRAFT_9843 [Chiua virens]
MKQEFYTEILKGWPDLGLCANNWKINYMATARYPSWAQSHITKNVKKRVKSEEVLAEPDSDAKRIKISDSETVNNESSGSSSMDQDITDFKLDALDPGPLSPIRDTDHHRDHHAPSSPLSELDILDSMTIDTQAAVPIALKPTNDTMSASDECTDNTQPNSGQATTRRMTSSESESANTPRLTVPVIPALKNPLYHFVYTSKRR